MGVCKMTVLCVLSCLSACLLLPHGLALADSAVRGLEKKLKRRPRRRGRRPLVARVLCLIHERWRLFRRRSPAFRGAALRSSASPPARRPDAPLRVVSVAPTPVADRSAASVALNALASAQGGLISRPASLASATPLGRSAPARLQPHDPDSDDEPGSRAGGDAGRQEVRRQVRKGGGGGGVARATTSGMMRGGAAATVLLPSWRSVTSWTLPGAS